MPPLTRAYIRLAFLYLVLAFVAGTVAAARQPLGLPPAAAAFGPVAVHLFVVGWITQMIFGVAYWMFPRWAPDSPRGPAAPAVATIVFLNAGLLIRVVAEPWHMVRSASVAGALLVASGILQWLAAALFAWHTWPRVRER